MEPVEGYKAPIHRVLTRVMTLAGVPRQIIMGVAMFCLGAGLACGSWGAIPLYLILHGSMAYASYREPLWPQILVEAIRYYVKVHRRRHLTLIRNDRSDDESPDAPSPRP